MVVNIIILPFLVEVGCLSRQRRRAHFLTNIYSGTLHAARLCSHNDIRCRVAYSSPMNSTRIRLVYQRVDDAIGTIVCSYDAVDDALFLECR